MISRIFRLVHLWPGTTPAESFSGFPIENHALRQSVTINICVNKYLWAQRWLGAGLTPHHLEKKVKKAMPKKHPLIRKSIIKLVHCKMMYLPMAGGLKLDDL